jgi:integrase
LERRLYFRHLLNDETACASMGRRGQIVRLRWRDIDLDVGAIEWGVTEKARKSRAAARGPCRAAAPRHLEVLYLEQGKPAPDQLYALRGSTTVAG